MLECRMTPARSLVWMALALSLGASAPARAADALVWRAAASRGDAPGGAGPPGRGGARAALVWRAAESRVDAQVEAWPLERVLQTIIAATGWQVYVEPGTEHAVTARFTDLKPADALLRLLGELNFALLPRARRSEERRVGR